MSIVGLKNLCTPAYVYLVISLVAIVIMMIQNYGNVNTYCVGSYSCSVTSTVLIFIIKMLYVLFWTWILNLICKDGHTGVAWFLVLIPFILMFVIMGMVMVNN